MSSRSVVVVLADDCDVDKFSDLHPVLLLRQSSHDLWAQSWNEFARDSQSDNKIQTHCSSLVGGRMRRCQCT